MILYFADRRFNIIGQASTGLIGGLTVVADKKTDDVETGTSVFDCKILFDAETRAKVEECVEVGNYVLRNNGTGNELYTIIDCEVNTKKQTAYIYAEDGGMDLLNEVYGEYAADKAYPISHYIEKYASSAGFQIGINEVENLTRQLSWENEQTATARIASVAAQFDGCEVSYSFDVNGLSVTGKYINIHKKRGVDDGTTLRLNKHIDSIVTSKSISNLATALQCTGGTPENSDFPVTLLGYAYDDGDFYVDGETLKSRNALDRWNRLFWRNTEEEQAGGHITKLFSCDSLDQKELCDLAIEELKLYRDMEVNYDVEIKELPENVRVGDRVNIVDEAGKLYLSTRILQLETSVADKEYKAVLGEHLLKGSGIHQKVADLAAQFAKNSASAARALTIAQNAQAMADDAKSAAEEAAKGVETAQGLVEEAEKAASNAAQSAQDAQAAANNAQSAVDNVNNSVGAIKNSVESAQAAAQKAEQAASTAEIKATEAQTAATNAAKDAENAKTASQSAQSAASNAVKKAETAESAAQTAKTEAQEAEEIAIAAKIDAEQAQKDIDDFGQDLTTLEDTMQAEYSRKTDLTEAQANLQTQITRNAAEIKSSAYKQIVIDETANNAASKVEAAQRAADLAQADADQAAEDAQAAQTAADEANAAALSAQAEADTAKAAADEAKRVADEAEADLKAAQIDLATISSRADATEEEIAAAQNAVNAAQSVVNSAQADVAEAVEKAQRAQSNAHTAATNAVNAQATANAAAQAARLAQRTADEAKGDATAAQTAAEEAAEVAEEAQRAANEAVENANNLQNAADIAAEEAAAAQNVVDAANANVDKAESDLAAAQQALADVLANVNATAEEVAAAQADVDAAQAAAESARADAEAAQATADTARASAEAAQSVADEAKSAAESAQRSADEAQAAVDKAYGIVGALERRVSTAETNIKQNSSEVQLKANKIDVAADLAGIQQRITEQSAEITASFDKVLLSALEKYVESNGEDYTALKEAVASLQVTAEGITAKVEKTESDIEAVDADLQAKFNEISLIFSITVDGVTIGRTESPYKLFLDDNEFSMQVNGQRVLWFEVSETGNTANVPELTVTEKFSLFGLEGKRDANGNINFVPIGG